jgi:hypothetical protein
VGVTVEVLSDASKIARLGELPFLGTLPTTAWPRFFLASTMRQHWIPRAVVVKWGAEVQGIAYFKERKLGIATGILYADFSLRGRVSAQPDRQELVLEQALTHLVDSTSVRGLRLRLPAGGYEAPLLKRIASSRGMKIALFDDPYHAVLPLFSGYEDFLQTLGYKARRNLRYYRRRFESAGHRYMERISLEDFGQVARRLRTRSVVRARDAAISRALNMFAEVDRPLLAGLQHSDGEWVAIIGGWLNGDLPVVFFQMNNDQDYRSESLSLVLRGYLFESLINQGYREVAFWGGVGEPFRQVAVEEPAVSAYLDVETRSWRVFREIVRKLGPYLPHSFRHGASWIAAPGKP